MKDYEVLTALSEKLTREKARTLLMQVKFSDNCKIFLQEIVTERAVNHLCGYVLCSAHPKKQSLRDAMARNSKFCSFKCEQAHRFLFKNLLCQRKKIIFIDDEFERLTTIFRHTSIDDVPIHSFRKLTF